MRVAILLGLFALVPQTGHAKAKSTSLPSVMKKYGLQFKFTNNAGGKVAELTGDYKQVQMRSDAQARLLTKAFGHGATEKEAVASLVEQLRGHQLIVSHFTPSMAAKKGGEPVYKFIDLSGTLRGPAK